MAWKASTRKIHARSLTYSCTERCSLLLRDRNSLLISKGFKGLQRSILKVHANGVMHIVIHCGLLHSRLKGRPCLRCLTDLRLSPTLRCRCQVESSRGTLLS